MAAGRRRHRTGRGGRTAFLALLLAGSLVAGSPFAGSLVAAPARAETPDFLLGPGDRVAVSVFRRPDLSGEFRILPGGTLSLPFLGSLPASGLPLSALRDAIQARLKEDAFLLDPRVTLDLVEARPVFVAGDVRRPGSYPFQFGMTVLHAITAAGGPRAVDTEELGAQIEIGNLREKLRQAQQGIGLALIRRERLQAERDGAADFTAPDTRRYLSEEKAAEVVASERRMMAQRDEVIRTQKAMIADQTALYRAEIQALTEQAESKQREGDLVLEETRYAQNLLRQGLTPRTPRINELQRLSIQLESDRRQIAAQIARARQEIVRLEQSANGLEQQRQIEVTGWLRDNADLLNGLTVTLEESHASLTRVGEALPAPGGARDAADRFVILRQSGGGTERIAARADTPLRPGDLVETAAR
ncbi:polysaccharide biosynthesis/export family protein [Roseomonas sp. OT10]|uniref:polysaccharide biosynthesis/export family protein n=1 Tax=Roseomonas cutis TaxID=2897332 RepID=UPI001E3CB221|nr:polysaccharide biosynthesis/export family protein [Roseomonas sp. OT10]UFN49839.1 polysaccharide biosynthesis/export family protein [Roseomonas sp. OT10]